MKITTDMMNCNGCEYLQALDGYFELACVDAMCWPEGVPDNPPCFKINHEAVRATFAIVSTEGKAQS